MSGGPELRGFAFRALWPVRSFGRRGGPVRIAGGSMCCVALIFAESTIRQPPCREGPCWRSPGVCFAEELCKRRELCAYSRLSTPRPPLWPAACRAGQTRPNNDVHLRLASLIQNLLDLTFQVFGFSIPTSRLLLHRRPSLSSPIFGPLFAGTKGELVSNDRRRVHAQSQNRKSLRYSGCFDCTMPSRSPARDSLPAIFECNEPRARRQSIFRVSPPVQRTGKRQS